MAKNDVIYLCDREDPDCAKEGCKEWCRYTRNVEHAKNFMKAYPSDPNSTKYMELDVLDSDPDIYSLYVRSYRADEEKMYFALLSELGVKTVLNFGDEYAEYKHCMFWSTQPVVDLIDRSWGTVHPEENDGE